MKAAMPRPVAGWTAAARSVVDQDGPLVVDRTGEVDGGDVQTHVVGEARPEHEFPHPRVQSVGTHDEVEPSRRPAFERDVHTVAVVGQ